MSARRNIRKDWTTGRGGLSKSYNASLEDMIDNSLPKVSHDVKPLAFSEEYEENINTDRTPMKQRCKQFICLMLGALLIIIPIVGAALYYFVSCYQNISLDNVPSLNNLTPVLTRNNALEDVSQELELNNVTRVLQSDNYDPFFHNQQKLKSNQELSRSLNSGDVNHDRICILNYFMLLASLLFGTIILVSVFGYSFS